MDSANRGSRTANLVKISARAMPRPSARNRCLAFMGDAGAIKTHAASLRASSVRVDAPACTNFFLDIFYT
jgi:hypothetical protein